MGAAQLLHLQQQRQSTVAVVAVLEHSVPSATAEGPAIRKVAVDQSSPSVPQHIKDLGRLAQAGTV